MYRVIGTTRYDTEKAYKLAEDSYGSFADPNHWKETLYRTKRSGRYFLHGEGGPMTKYAEEIGQNRWKEGEKIIPLTEEAAKSWARDHCSTSTFSWIFGKGKEARTETLLVKLKPSVKKALDEIGSKTGESYADTIERLILTEVDTKVDMDQK